MYDYWSSIINIIMQCMNTIASCNTETDEFLLCRESRIQGIRWMSRCKLNTILLNYVQANTKGNYETDMKMSKELSNSMILINIIIITWCLILRIFWLSQ